jgi:Skp family chaperone for outer membrane proteins
MNTIDAEGLKHMSKNTVILALVIAVLAAFTLAAQQKRSAGPNGVAFVSAQRIMTESIRGKAEAAKLQAFQQQKAGELRARQQTLEATRRELVSTTDPARRATLQQQEQVQRADFERASAEAQIGLQTLQRKVNTDLQAEVKLVLDEVVKNGDTRVVLNSDAAVLWGNPSDDITTSVLERMNLKSALKP